jgi:hypothetical protein
MPPAAFIAFTEAWNACALLGKANVAELTVVIWPSTMGDLEALPLLPVSEELELLQAARISSSTALTSDTARELRFTIGSSQQRGGRSDQNPSPVGAAGPSR